MSTSSTYDNTQSAYNVSRILTHDYQFNLTAYKAYSPMFLAPTFALNYGLSFAALMAVIVHTAMFHGKEIWYRFRAARNQEPDVHMRLMKKYDEAPDWWYGALFVIAMGLGLATVLGFDSQLPCKLISECFSYVSGTDTVCYCRVGILGFEYRCVSVHRKFSLPFHSLGSLIRGPSVLTRIRYQLA